jgi:hypothetical protein
MLITNDCNYLLVSLSFISTFIFQQSAKRIFQAWKLIFFLVRWYVIVDTFATVKKIRASKWLRDLKCERTKSWSYRLALRVGLYLMCVFAFFYSESINLIFDAYFDLYFDFVFRRDTTTISAGSSALSDVHSAPGKYHFHLIYIYKINIFAISVFRLSIRPRVHSNTARFFGPIYA